MNTNITIWYFILITTIILEVTAKTNNVIHEIGSQLCPHTSFCQRNATPYNDPGVFLRPCCSECSCEENCWETANCCPDKDMIESQEPITKCIADIVKKTAAFGRARFGYHVIDYCPMTEENVTLVNKCTIKQAASFEELIWVSDDISGKIYRNKFCAECHHVTSNVKEWSLEAKCTSDVYASLDNLESFFLSNKCQLTIREPEKLNAKKFTGCEVPEYTTCNETGMWKNFDADVKLACHTFEAPFFVRKPQSIDEFVVEAYKNAYCYVCNTNTIGNTEVLCPLPGYDPLDVSVFSTLVDYKRYQQADDDQTATTTETLCKGYEIMDEIMHTCRLLKCPFGSTPMDGKCKPLFEGTTGLYIDILFAITVLWSRSEYKLDDKTSALTTLGENIMDHFLNESQLVGDEWQCPYCYLELQMTADVYEQGANDVSETGVHDKEHGLNNEANTDMGNVAKENNQHEALNSDHTATLPAFIMKVVLFTVPECQLQNIFDIATGLFGKVIDVQVDGETEMRFKVELLTGSLNQTFKVIKKMNSQVFNCKVKGAHSLKDDKLCSKISITYTEFKPYLTNDNTDIIYSFFEKKHIETGEPTDVCITTYYERLQSVDFQILSQGSVIFTDARLYLGLIFLPRLLRLSDHH